MIALHPPKLINITDNNIPEVKIVKVWLERSLKDWTWQLTKTKHIILINKKTNETFTLDKVRLLSFMSFAIRALDKMRIEENKILRKKVNRIKEKSKTKVKKVKKRFEKQQLLFAKAKKVKK
jgi:hypothetical protein